jgi:hypothetical protein
MYLESPIREALQGGQVVATPVPSKTTGGEGAVERAFNLSNSHSIGSSSRFPLQRFFSWLTPPIAKCGALQCYTLEFALEDGAWRIAHTDDDSSRNGQAWFKSDLKPVRTFPSINLRDRSRYFNEGTLGKALGLNVSVHDCSKAQEEAR